MKAARTDSNQAEIVAALRRAGASVAITSSLGGGFPDLVAGLNGKTYLLEVKDGTKPPSKRRLTPAESRFHASWLGHVCVVETEDEALAAVGLT